MSKERGFSVRVQGETRVGIGLTKTNNTTWLVDELTAAAAGEPLPEKFCCQLADGKGNLTWIVPDDQVRAVLLNLPLLKGKELKRSVLGMVARQEKCNPEELIVSWKSLGRHTEPGAEPGQDLVSLVMSREDCQEHLVTAEAMGVQPACILPGYSVLDQMFRLAGPPIPNGGAWTLVYLGGDENFLNISSSESLMLTRSLPVRLAEGQDETEYLERLGTEIDRSRFFIRQGANSPEIQQIVVCGDPALAVPLVDHLNEDGAITAVHWAAEHLFSHQGQDIQPEFLIPMLGAALSLENPLFNLSSRGRRKFLGARGRRRLALAGTALAISFVPIVLAGSLLTAQIQENYLERAQQRLEIAQLDAQEAAEVYKASRLLANQEMCLDWRDHQRLDVQGLLLQLAEITPDQVVFRNLRVWDGQDGGFKLQIIGDSRGTSAEAAQAAYLEFQKSLSGLKALEGFLEPRVLEIESIRNKGKFSPLTRFTLDLEIAPQGQEQS